MDIEETRRLLRSGALGQLPEAEPNADPILFGAMPDDGADWPDPDDADVILEKHRTGSVAFRRGPGRHRASVPVGLDKGRQIASKYRGPRMMEMKFTDEGGVVDIGRVLMVWPCWAPGIEGETRPTDAHKTCYRVEIELDYEV